MSERIAATIFYGRIENGKPVLERAESFARLKQNLEGQEIEITLQKRRRKRSSAANRFYWKVLVGMVSDHTGHTRDEVHEGFKHRFLVERVDEGLPRVRSTSSLDTGEFARYVEDCMQLAAEMGIVVPDPESA